MHALATAPTLPQPAPDVRYRIADLLAQIEADNDGLDPRIAIHALVETAYRAALTFSETPGRAWHYLDAAVREIDGGGNFRVADAQPAIAARAHLGAVTPRPGPPPVGSSPFTRVVFAVIVAILSWATIAFLAHRGQLSRWNLLGPMFCTVLAFVSTYRFLVTAGRMRPWTIFLRRPRLRSL